MTKVELIVTIVLALIASNGFWGYLQYRSEKKAKKKKHTIAHAIEKIDELKEELDENSALTVATARARLNTVSNQYIEQGYIPKKDIVAYKMLGEAYCKHNNSEVKTRFEWCIKNLKVK